MHRPAWPQEPVGDQMRYRHARNAVAAGIAATLVATLGPAAADAAVHPGAGAPTGAAVPHPDLVPGESDLMAVFYDGRGVRIPLRRGYWIRSQGYGWERIKGKHALTSMAVVRAVIRDPDGGRLDPRQPTHRIYTAFVRHPECLAAPGCRHGRRLPVTAVVDFGEAAHFAEVLGVTTAYCENPDGEPTCPEWVSHVRRVTYSTRAAG
jgi:hypothetical protein